MRTAVTVQNAGCGAPCSAPRNTQHATGPTPLATRAFTMIEIAISLAIIGFALVAIIGVLPRGMNIQQNNREETIINQDFSVLLNAIRNGAKGVDDLTNYVIAITNWVTAFKPNGLPTGVRYVYGYDYQGSSINGSPGNYPITNGLRIVGLLSTPKYFTLTNPPYGFLSNHVVAYVRSMSGAASEKFPQNNPDVQDLSFRYCMIPEIILYTTNYYDLSWVNYLQPNLSAAEIVARSNTCAIVNNIQANLHDVRVIFRWPLWSRGKLGPNGRSFRTLVGGLLQETNEPGFLRLAADQPSPYDLYFFDPRTYVQAPPL